MIKVKYYGDLAPYHFIQLDPVVLNSSNKTINHIILSIYLLQLPMGMKTGRIRNMIFQLQSLTVTYSVCSCYCNWQEFQNNIIYNPTLRSRIVLVEPDAPWTHPVTMTAIVPGLKRRVSTCFLQWAMQAVHVFLILVRAPGQPVNIGFRRFQNGMTKTWNCLKTGHWFESWKTTLIIVLEFWTRRKKNQWYFICSYKSVRFELK